ncbi:Tubby protein [Hondaea fermentalgiana]|uniref:Tubby protein n=1 Tax=Hondaea fermentalgiana TaxID=2315210 RepID=A0A2R5GJ40_9STRA|nr:Tubby protein [Hondaea fermentalgiana]|eukprot:GBG29748.1 Tubby protein [Hondaea fermentalgiana]
MGTGDLSNPDLDERVEQDELRQRSSKNGAPGKMKKGPAHFHVDTRGLTRHNSASPRRTLRQVKDAENANKRSMELKLNQLHQAESCAPVSPRHTPRKNGRGPFTPRGANASIMRGIATQFVKSPLNVSREAKGSGSTPHKNSNNNNNNNNDEDDKNARDSRAEDELLHSCESPQQQAAAMAAAIPNESLLRVPRVGPTEMALRTHREVVLNVKDFVTAPVSKSLGTLECSMTNYMVEGQGLFSSPTEVWELRITDPRVHYEGVATFTNVPDATGTGFASDGPQVADLRKNRLVVVAEKRTRGFMHKTSSFIFTMADCSNYHQRVVEKASHLLGKLESENVWGTEYTGYDLSESLKARQYAIPLKKESMHIRYDCTVGNPRQLLVAIPKLSEAAEARADGCGPDTDPSTGKERNAEEEPGLWKNEIPPSPDMDLGCQVVASYKQDGVKRLAQASEEFDLGTCLCFHNRKPLWDDDMETHILDFGGRVTHPSVKNFQLDPSPTAEDHTFIDYECEEQVILSGSNREAHMHRPIVQFGRNSPHSPISGVSHFALDVRYPFSPIQAMQLAMTSVEHKIVYN